MGHLFDAVIFDLGGVLVELGDLTDILGDDPMTETEFWPLWLASPTVRDFESGRCGPEEFGDRLVREFGLGFSGPELVERFRVWPKGLYAGAADLIGKLESVTVGALSNSNPIHWEGQKDAGEVQRLIAAPFLSHQVGMIKPDPEIYHHVQATLDVAAHRLLFLDDNQINVDAARQAGWHAEVTKGPVEAEHHLVKHAVITSD